MSPSPVVVVGAVAAAPLSSSSSPSPAPAHAVAARSPCACAGHAGAGQGGGRLPSTSVLLHAVFRARLGVSAPPGSFRHRPVPSTHRPGRRSTGVPLAMSHLTRGHASRPRRWTPSHYSLRSASQHSQPPHPGQKVAHAPVAPALSKGWCWVRLHLYRCCGGAGSPPPRYLPTQFPGQRLPTARAPDCRPYGGVLCADEMGLHPCVPRARKRGKLSRAEFAPQVLQGVLDGRRLT